MGNMAEYVKMAIENIKSNKVRSILTMLGIIIGISSVIMIMSIGEGVTISMNNQLESIGGGQAYLGLGEKATSEDIWITDEDLNIVEGIDGVESASPSVSILGNAETARGTFNVNLNGSTPIALERSTNKLKYGKFYSGEDIANRNPVAVILDKEAKSIFGTDDVVGMVVDIDVGDGYSTSFKIIGVTTSEKDSPIFSGRGDENSITLEVPWRIVDDYSEEAFRGKISNMSLYMDKKKDSNAIVKKVVRTLEKKYQLEHDKNYFYVENFQDVSKEINNTLGIMTTFVALVGGISLLVGGIGVMNIMLVSVTERTREIGIRKSLGAKTASIMTQFLAESAILTVIGGIIGIILGLLSANLLCGVISNMMEMSVKPYISIVSITVATLFSTIVGIFFGLYPAKKAAKMNPIEALRRE